MADENKTTEILEFQVEQGDAIADLEKTRKSIIQLKEEQAALNKAYKAGNVTLDEYASETVRLDQILKKQNRTYGELTHSVQGTKSWTDKLKDSFKEQTKQANVAGVSIGDLTEKLSGASGFTIAAGGAVALVGALATAYVSSAAGARDLESAQNQLNTSMLVFNNTLAKAVGADGKGGGLLSAFAFHINRALFGIDAAATGLSVAVVKNTLKEIELAELDAQRFAKEQLQLSEQQRQLRDDQTKSFDERLAAAKAVDVFVNRREEELVKIQQKKLDQLNILLRLDEHNLELQKAVKVVEFEIADIREDSEGKRTEALNGILALEREEQDRLKAAQEEQRKLNKEVDDYVKKVLEAIDAPRKAEQQRKQQRESTSGAGQSFAEQIGLPSSDEVNAHLKTLVKPVEIAEERKRELWRQSSDIYIQEQERQINAAQASIANIQSIFDENSAEYQALALIQNGIDTYRAATAALAPPPTGAGPLFGPILAATTIAAGLANAARIAGFAAGGGDFVTKGPSLLLVGDNPGGRERVTVEPLSGKGQTKIFGPNMVAMAGGGQLYTDGGLAKNAATQETNNAIIFANAIKNMPRPVVGWAEGKRVRDAVEFKEKISRI